VSAVTDPRPGAGPAGPAGGGTVFDIGYQRYTGIREGRRRGRWAIFKDGVRTALGLGRGGRAKILPWLFIGILNFIALIMALVAGTVERLGGEGAAEQAGLPSHGDFYGIASMVLFVFAALVAPELLCRDRRDGTINLYLVRPITGTDYIVSRWTAFLVVMLGAAWVPQMVLFTGLVMGDPAPATYLQTYWLDVPRFLLAGLAVAAYMTTLALLTASFTTRRAVASVFLVGLFFISAPFTIGLAQEIGGTAGQWISMFNLTNIPIHVNDLIFGEASEVTQHQPASELPGATLVSWYLAWTLIPGAILWLRYRRLTP
jgi:ABC-2 type transport system permease protein